MFVEFSLFNKHLHSAYWVPGNVLRILQRSTQLIPISYNSHSGDEKTEAEKCKNLPEVPELVSGRARG